MTSEQSFGSYIKGLRLAKKLNQTEVAENIGIKKQYLSRIENNHDVPAEDILIRLAITLDEDPYEMVVKAGKVPSDFRDLIVSDQSIFEYLKQKSIEKTNGV